MLGQKGQIQLPILVQWAGSWRGLGHHSIDGYPAQHRDPETATHWCGSPAFSCWRQHQEPGQLWTSSAAQGQAKAKNKGFLWLVTKGSSWWRQELQGPLAARWDIREGAAVELMILMSIGGRLQGFSPTTSLTRGLGLTVRGLNWTKCFSYLEENMRKKEKPEDLAADPRCFNGALALKGTFMKRQKE